MCAGVRRRPDIAAQQPALGPIAAEKLIKPGVVRAGTVRRYGTARASGVEPLVMEGELWLSMMPSSAQAGDLCRDSRVVLNSIIDSAAPEAEVKVRGTAVLVTDQAVQARYAAPTTLGEPSPVRRLLSDQAANRPGSAR